MNLEPAHETAIYEFSSKLPEEMAGNSLANYDQVQQKFSIEYLQKEYYITYPTGEVEMAGYEQEVSKSLQILLLHYLTQATPVQVKNKSISFKEMPGGMMYIQPFTNRAIRPLVGIFGSNPQNLIKAGKSLGGIAGSIGDAAVTLTVLPKIPVTFVIWEGDDEFPPSGNIVYDSSAVHLLPTEDYALLPSLVLSEMKKYI